MKYILSIDPSLNSTGYSILDENKIIVDINKIVSTSKETETARIKKILTTLNQFVFKYNIKTIVIEDGFIGINKKGSLGLAKLRGAIVGFFEMQDVSVVERQPKETRKDLGVGGNASKEQVAEYILNLYPELLKRIGPYSDKSNKDKTSDMYDSVCIGRSYLNQQE